MKFAVARFIATCGFVGFFPLAPGTAGSVLAALTLYFLPPIAPALLLSITGALLFAGVIASNFYARTFGRSDPAEVVIDEWVGMWLGLLFAPKTLLAYVIGFLLFRFFDIAKPYPLHVLERLPGGFGIMLDDVAAGLITSALLCCMF